MSFSSLPSVTETNAYDSQSRYQSNAILLEEHCLPQRTPATTLTSILRPSSYLSPLQPKLPTSGGPRRGSTSIVLPGMGTGSDNGLSEHSTASLLLPPLSDHRRRTVTVEATPPVSHHRRTNTYTIGEWNPDTFVAGPPPEATTPPLTATKSPYELSSDEFYSLTSAVKLPRRYGKFSSYK
ncbi:hypothetical protein ADEAN_000141800 [Angomonas deanei]|uniref:Uncharacterized protein n=1 Tax=Angomonas deanei TaxID=59799 RepID=A0A7G2C438_9TRYP|nr:hypothetical protein ADEAN_000141800 [Angomonas deanei]